MRDRLWRTGSTMMAMTAVTLVAVFTFAVPAQAHKPSESPTGGWAGPTSGGGWAGPTSGGGWAGPTSGSTAN